jgi:hypothetical protein
VPAVVVRQCKIRHKKPSVYPFRKSRSPVWKQHPKTP